MQLTYMNNSDLGRLFYRRYNVVHQKKIYREATTTRFICPALLQTLSSDYFCVPVGTYSVCALLQLNHFIRYPTDLEARQYMRDTQAVAGFPGVVGLIDGTHVKIGRIPATLTHVYNHRQNSKYA